MENKLLAEVCNGWFVSTWQSEETAKVLGCIADLVACVLKINNQTWATGLNVQMKNRMRQQMSKKTENFEE